MCLSVISVSAEPPITVLLDGNLIEFDQPPIIENDRTLVPVRKIFEAMGATVDWNEETNTATGTKGYIIIVMQIGNNIITKNGQQIELDVPPQIVNDRTLVPVRAVAEGLNCTVGWDDDSQQVSITTAPTDNGLPTFPYTPTYNDVYERGYDLGYSRGEASGKKNGSFDEYDKAYLAMGNEGLNDEAKKNFNEGFANGWADGYEIGLKAWEEEQSNPKPSPTAPIEQIFKLPDLPMALKYEFAPFEIQINEVVINKGVDGNNQPNPKKTTVTLSCEILQIPDRCPQVPSLYINVAMTDEQGRSIGSPNAKISAKDLGIFSNYGDAKKQVGDTFDVTFVLDYGFPNVADTRGNRHINVVRFEFQGY
jgi:hypothetical protein